MPRALVAAAGPRRPPGAWLGLARSDTGGLSQILSLSPCAEFDSRHRPAQARPAAWPRSCDSGRLPGLRALSPRRWPGAAEEPFSFPRVFSLVCSGGLWLGPGLHAARTLLGGRRVRAQPVAAAQAPPRRPPRTPRPLGARMAFPVPRPLLQLLPRLRAGQLSPGQLRMTLHVSAAAARAPRPSRRRSLSHDAEPDRGLSAASWFPAPDLSSRVGSSSHPHPQSLATGRPARMLTTSSAQCVPSAPLPPSRRKVLTEQAERREDSAARHRRGQGCDCGCSSFWREHGSVGRPRAGDRARRPAPSQLGRC